LVGDIQMEATSFVQKAVSKTNDDLVKRRDELSANQKATQQEIMQKRRKHALLTKQFETIQTSLADFRKSMR
jgi:prefoldin subunit 5